MNHPESLTEVAQVEPIVVERLPQRSSPTLYGVAFIAVTSLFFGGVYIGQDFLVDRPHNAGLYVEPQYLNFGEVWAEKEFKWRIPIQNRSDREVGIAEFTASCQCDLIEPPSLTIPPHSTAEVVATIDLTLGRDTEPYDAVREFKIAIHPIVAVATSRPPGFVLRGTAKDVFATSPRQVELSEILSRTAGKPTSIRLKAATPLASLTALSQPDMGIEIKPLQASPSPPLPVSPSPPLEKDAEPSSAQTIEYLLTVTPSDQIPLGQVDRTILVQATDLQGRKLPVFPVQVTGEIVFDVAIEPRAVYAGLVEMDETYETILTLRSRTGARFALIPVDQEPGITLEPTTPASSPPLPVSPSPPLSLDPFLAEDGLLQTAFLLRLTPQSRSDQRTIARFQAINLTTGEQADFDIPIIYNGAEPRPVRPKDVFTPHLP